MYEVRFGVRQEFYDSFTRAMQRVNALYWFDEIVARVYKNGKCLA